MHYRLLFILVLFLEACGPTPEPPNTPLEAPATPSIEGNTPDSDPEFQQFTGSGNEPGWSIVLDYKREQQYGFELETDYGQTKARGTLIQIDDTTYRGKTLDNAAIVVTIQHEKCVDDGDRVYAYSVQVEWNGQTLRGCGNPVE